MADHTPIDRPPLWRAMRRAESSCASDLFSPEARMIRAVRDWLAPPEIEAWQHSQRLRAILTAEIDRAQRGEGSNA